MNTVNNKKLEKKILTFKDGSQALLVGNIKIVRGIKNEEPEKVEVITDIEDNEFEKAIKNPLKFKLDRQTKKARPWRKNEKRKN